MLQTKGRKQRATKACGFMSAPNMTCIGINNDEVGYGCVKGAVMMQILAPVCAASHMASGYPGKKAWNCSYS
eukprot:scaffold189403_cov42-Prasinocladus_malaysianus.AAC.1